MMDVRQTQEHAAFLKAIGWTIEKSPSGVFAFIKRLPIIPVSVIKIQRIPASQVDFSWIRQLAQKHHAFAAYLETSDIAISGHGFSVDRSPMLPTKTLVVDLKNSENQLLKEMSSKTRYNIHLAEKKKLITTVVTGQDIISDAVLFDEYYALMEKNSRRLHTFELPKKWLWEQLNAFGKKSFVVVVRKEELIAAAMYICSDDGVFYSHNGSSEEGRRLFAPTLCVWEGMREGKRRGLRWFDFEGIYDERHPLPRWKGFTRFKVGFGGVERSYPPVLYRLLPGWG